MNGAVFTLSAEAGLVCRMEVNKRKEKFTGEYEEAMQNFSFLSSKKKLDENPKKYLHFYGSRR